MAVKEKIYEKVCLLLMAVFFSVCLTAQPTTADKDLTADDISHGKKLYSNMIMTSTYLAKNRASSAIIKKLNGIDIPEELIDEKKWHDWVVQNINMTSFKSVSEADTTRKENLELTIKLVTENQELFDLLKRATPEQVVEMFTP